MEKDNSPIFIHSLWRSGSTYIFDVFRKSPQNFTCYQESIHELPVECVNQPERLLDLVAADDLIRHPVLEKPYFQELFDAFPSWKETISKEMVYDQYFNSDDAGHLAGYISSLIQASPSRPVFQETRTGGRIDYLKKRLAGSHIYLWRNPRNQFWSFMKGRYFRNACLLILNAENIPPLLVEIKKKLNFIEFHNDSIVTEMRHFNAYEYSFDEQYILYFAIWCINQINGFNSCELIINMDMLSNSNEYRKEIISDISNIGVNDIFLDECAMPYHVFSNNEIDFFEKIEEDVYTILSEQGYSSQILSILRSSAQVDKFGDPPKTKILNNQIRDLRQVLRQTIDLSTEHLNSSEANRQEAVSDASFKITAALATQLEEHAAFEAQRKQLSDEKSAEALQYQGQITAHLERLATLQLEHHDEIEHIRSQSQTEINELCKQNALAQTELSSVNTALAQAQQSRIDEIHLLIESHRANIEKRDATILNFSAEALQHQGQITAHLERLATLQLEHHDEIEHIRSQSQTEINESRKQIALAQTDLSSVNTALAQAQQSRIDEIHLLIESHRDNIEKRDVTILNLVEHARDAESSLVQKIEEIGKELALEQERHRHSIAHQSGIIAQKDDDIASRNAAMAGLSAKLSDAEAARADERITANSEIAVLASKLNSASLLIAEASSSDLWGHASKLQRFLGGPQKTLLYNRLRQHLLGGQPDTDMQSASPGDTIHIYGENEMLDHNTDANRAELVRARTLSELLGHDDSIFVRCAYLTVLGRAADADGYSHYLGWLRRGAAKQSILWQLRKSAEGRAHDPLVAGLDRVLRKHRNATRPVVGALLRWLRGAEGRDGINWRIRAIQNDIAMLRYEQQQLVVAPLKQKDVLAAERSNSPEVSPCTKRQTYDASVANTLPPKARDIYTRLISTK